MAPEISPKDHLFATAARLFYQHGYRAVGVDMIAAESGIGKMTLYRHYPSKEALILAFLQASDTQFWDEFEQVTSGAKTARAQLTAFFEALGQYAVSPACFGCPFLNLATEFPEADHPGHHLSLEHKQAVRARFEQLVKMAGAKQPRELADGLFLLMDGAYMGARMFGPSPANPASHLAAAARMLLDAGLGV